MAKVFISFIHEEQDVASAVQLFLQTQLETREIFVSSDPWMVFAGDDWLQRIRDELRSCAVVVLLLSPNSVTRPWVNFEAGAAWLAQKPIVPASFGGLTKDQLPKPYSSIQALNLPDDAYYLLTSVARHLGISGPPPWLESDTDPASGIRRAIRGLAENRGM